MQGVLGILITACGSKWPPSMILCFIVTTELASLRRLATSLGRLVTSRFLETCCRPANIGFIQKSSLFHDHSCNKTLQHVTTSKSKHPEGTPKVDLLEDGVM